MDKVKLYLVNIRPLPVEERERVEKLLSEYSFICNISAHDPLVLKSYWNDPAPIEQVLGIPPELIRLVAG